MSLLKQEIIDLKSGKCDEHARAAAVYRGKGNVQREPDSIGNRSFKQFHQDDVVVFFLGVYAQGLSERFRGSCQCTRACIIDQDVQRCSTVQELVGEVLD